MKDDRLYLVHIRDAIDRVLHYTMSGRTAFFADARTQDAVVRNLEVIGEAARRASPAMRDRAPEVPWKVIGGMRDKLIHEYFGVNLEIEWLVVERDLPPLRAQLETLLLGDGPGDRTTRRA